MVLSPSGSESDSIHDAPLKAFAPIAATFSPPSSAGIARSAERPTTPVTVQVPSPLSDQVKSYAPKKPVVRMVVSLPEASA